MRPKKADSGADPALPTTEAYEELRRVLPYDISFQEYVDFIEEGLNVLLNGTLVVDRSGTVVFYSRSYQDFLGIERSRMLGKHCTEAIENSRMHIVARTGVPEIGHSQRINNQEMVVQRIPIRKRGEIIGAVGLVMFRKVEDVVSLMEQLDLLASKVEFYEKELAALRSAKYSLKQIHGTSPAIRQAKKEVLDAALSRAPVLITGESGTGKELFAHAIHAESDRKRFPFVRLNCAAIPETLLEAELFGYEPGAFTGAGKTGKPGKFEMAHQGTIFLDEISEMPKSMQAKLLRVLQEKEIERLGGTRLIRSDFRLITATNSSLESLVKEGRFRQDLYYRLNVIPIRIPPLRERREDIPIIIEHKLRELREDLGSPCAGLSEDAVFALQRYHWPGNIRELVNVLERLLCTVKGRTILAEDLPPAITRCEASGPSRDDRSLETQLMEAEKRILLDTLQETGNNKAEAARRLGIHRTAIYKKLRRFGIR